MNNKKSCILTDTGRKKLEDALIKRYANGEYNISQIALNTGIDRGVVSKILDPKGLKPVNSCKPLTFSSLDKLFSFLTIDLEDDDFREANKEPNVTCNSPQYSEPESDTDSSFPENNTSDIIEKLKKLIPEKVVSFCKNRQEVVTFIMDLWNEGERRVKKSQLVEAVFLFEFAMDICKFINDPILELAIENNLEFIKDKIHP